MGVVLVIGFVLHNATEGFGIVAPLAADLDSDGTATRPSWAMSSPCSSGFAARAKRTGLPAYGLLLGLVVGFIIDAIVTAGGA